VDVPDVDRFEAKGNTRKLLKALRDRDTEVRRAACLSLGKIGDEAAVSPVTDRLVSDQDGYVRSAAARALERLRSASAVPRLIWSLENDEDDFVRKCAASALGNIRDERAIPALRQAADPVRPRPDLHVDSHQAAIKALGRFGTLPAGDSSMEFTRFGPGRPVRATQKAALPEVVGGSFYQEALARVASTANWGDDGWVVGAQLCAEPSNAHDPNAVRVAVRGETVGYLRGTKRRDSPPRFRRTWSGARRSSPGAGDTARCRSVPSSVRRSSFGTRSDPTRG